MIASHSGCRALSNYTRNMSDDMIKALAAKGGVIHINLGCDFLSQRYYDAARPLEAKLRERYQSIMQLSDAAAKQAAIEQLRAEFKSQVPPATLQDVVAQIDHAVKVGGIDAVGIGTDFDGVSCTPAELDGYDKFPALTRALLQAGYTPNDIRKIYGGNLLRVMRAVEKQARLLNGAAAK
jgi:membrane dipeptidase